MAKCSNALRAEGKPYPRTCAECGLGPCHYLPLQRAPKDYSDLIREVSLLSGRIDLTLGLLARILAKMDPTFINATADPEARHWLRGYFKDITP